MRSSLLVLGLLGCGAEPVANPCELGASEEVSFELDAPLCVQLEMDPDDFVALGEQFRFEGGGDAQFNGVMTHVLESCTAPFPDPYTYFPADLWVNGLSAREVGVRKKGFVGSVLAGSVQRPSLKIKTDVYVEDQRLDDDTERITLNNNLTDLTRMHTCLVYSVFADADYPAPRCNLATVMVNGEALGTYTHVEALKKRFLRRAFGNDDGSLYELTLTDFTEEQLADGLGRWEPKTDDTREDTALLMAVADALRVEDSALEEALAEVLDLEMFLEFWALETLVAHNDGFSSNTNNSYVYFDPDRGDRAVFIPWGTDDAMSEALASTYVRAELTRRLSRHPELRARYLDALERLLAEVWDEDRLAERVALMASQVRATEPEVERHQEVTEGLLAWIEGRRGEVEVFIDEGGEEGAPEPRDCTELLPLDEFMAMSELVSTFGQGCATGPGRAAWAWAWVLLLLWGRRRRG